MLLIELFKGILIGMLASIPLGPVGVVCIQRTLSQSHRAGFVSGFGATFVDTIYAALALFSLALVTQLIDEHLTVLKLIGGMSVMVVGTSIFLKNPIVQIRRSRAGEGSLWSDFLSVVLLTVANPASILIFVALFAGVGISVEGSAPINSLAMLLGVSVGSGAWWFLMTLCVSLLRSRIRARHLLWINRLSGAAIVLLGAATILSIYVNLNASIDAILPQ